MNEQSNKSLNLNLTVSTKKETAEESIPKIDEDSALREQENTKSFTEEDLIQNENEFGMLKLNEQSRKSLNLDLTVSIEGETEDESIQRKSEDLASRNMVNTTLAIEQDIVRNNNKFGMLEVKEISDKNLSQSLTVSTEGETEEESLQKKNEDSSSREREIIGESNHIFEIVYSANLNDSTSTCIIEEDEKSVEEMHSVAEENDSLNDKPDKFISTTPKPKCHQHTSTMELEETSPTVVSDIVATKR